MDIDWAQIAAILGLIGTIMTAVSATLGLKWKKAVDTSKAFLAASTTLMEEVKAANADGNVTQEEFNVLLDQIVVVNQKATEAIKAGEDLFNELNAVAKRFMDIVNARAANDAGGK